MSTKTQWSKRGTAILAAAVLCLGSLGSATSQTHKKTAKKPQPQQPTLPSGPTGPMQQIPLDSIAAVPPQVSYQNNQLTIVAPNSTLADILRAVKKLTGAEIEIPAAPERVVTHLGPGPARDVVADLLNGSRFNYVLLGSPSDETALTRVVLVAKNGPQEITPNPPPVDPALGIPQQPNVAQGQPETPPDSADAEPADDAQQDDTSDQNGEASDQTPPQENPGVKTPQQMLQEMQQRQLQLQQQQPPGQPPVPGSGMPPHPPQEN